ncbi:PAS domain S-box protein [Fictibacillus barbaricus]|uniref:histidine kinase n=1 Tax=Fictibacillus barbaricus TaxID=182136 RepID=A0ABS2Z9E4_9BACL|nr:PAS domain S-box protein [Fictibacillus barbaricus]MBN3544795.1 PAS domain S-box protein [Fictibacillus barbaricus]GGB63989.1 sporulation kinase A [Fictibacillus barbaricus]
MKISDGQPVADDLIINQMKKYANQFEYSETPFLIQKDRKWVYVNPAARKILEAEEDIIGNPIWNNLHTDIHDLVEERIQSCGNGVAPRPSEQTWITEKGNQVQLEVIGFPLMFSSDATQIIIRNITQQNIEKQETLDHLKLITENMIDIIGIVNDKGIFTFLTPSYGLVTGYTEKESIGTSPFDLVHPEDRTLVISEFTRMITEHIPLTVEYRYLIKDGSYIWLESKGKPICNKDFHSAIVASREITKRKDAEYALKKNEYNHRIILEHSNDLICLVDPEGNYLYASLSYKDVLGIDPQTLLGTNSLNCIHTEDHALVTDYINRIAASENPLPLVYRKMHASGKAILLEGKGMPMHSDQGDLEGIVFISRDITEKKKADEYIRNSEKLAVLGELAAGVAHEIRNPLTSIKGLFSLMKNGDFDREKYYLYNEVICDELDRIEYIVNEFMALAKPDATQYKSKVNLVQLLQDTVMLLTSEANLFNVEIRLLFKEKKIYVSCESNQIKQVFINIIKNAIDAMSEGGILTIGIKESENNTVTLIFIDNGIGIEEERLKSIGVPFFTNKEKGIGLGLTISNKIITEHKGVLKVESLAGKGTTVSISLPKTE